MDEIYVTQKLISSVSELFEPLKIENYFGVSRSLKILNHVNNCITVEGIKDKKIILSLRYASILHGVDNPMFFKKNNSREIIKTYIDDAKIESYVYKLLDYIYNDKCSNAQWMLFPRYAHMLESLGKMSLVRLYFYYCFYEKPIESNKKIKSVEYYKNINMSECVPMNNMIETYSHFLKYKIYLEKCNIPYIVNETRERCFFMEEYISNFEKNFNVEEIIKINKFLREKRLI